MSSNLDKALALEAGRRGGPACLTCHSPNRKWIEKKQNEGASYSALSRALKRGANETICEGAIRNHFLREHHLNG